MILKKIINSILLVSVIATFQLNSMNKNLSVKELNIAIKTNNFEKFKRIVESYPDMENLFEQYMHIFVSDPLKEACEYDNLEMIKYFIEEKKIPACNYENKNENFFVRNYAHGKKTPLLCLCNKLDTFKYLLQKGCNIKHNFTMNDSFEAKYAINYASEKGNLEVVKYIIEDLKEDAHNFIRDALKNAKFNIFKYARSKLFEINFKERSLSCNDYLHHLNSGLFYNPQGLKYMLTEYGIETIFIEMLIRNPGLIASIISNNGCLYENTHKDGNTYISGIRKFLKNGLKKLAPDDKLKEAYEKDIVVKFLIEAIKSCKNIKLAHKNTPQFLIYGVDNEASNFLNNMGNTLIVFNILSGCRAIKPGIPKKDCMLMCDDTAASIMAFSGYECDETPKNKAYIKKLRSQEFKKRFYADAGETKNIVYLEDTQN